MNYAWNNDSLWQITLTQDDLRDFVQPYLGNGLIGCRFDKLIIGVDPDQPLATLTKAVYDDGSQLFLPAWNQVFLTVGDVAYRPDQGRHNLAQTLDLRTGLVSLTDQWTYAPEKDVSVTIKMMVPRAHRFSSYLSFRLEGLTEPATLEFGLVGRHVIGHYDMRFDEADQRTLVGDYLTRKQHRRVTQLLQWKSHGLTRQTCEATAHGALIKTQADGQTFELALYHTIGSYAEHADPRAGACAAAAEFLKATEGDLIASNARAWKELWKDGLAFHHPDPTFQKGVLVHQFFLLCSLSEDVYPLGALGLSWPGWRGSQLWDADFWMFRAILPLWPQLARSIVAYRRRMLTAAQSHAAANGFDGAWYGWETNDEGVDIAPVAYKEELHLNVWIAMAAWECWRVNRDETFLKQTVWPVIQGVADFFASRVEMQPDGCYHLRFVIGPDEAVCESGPGRCHDNFLTNFGVKQVMAVAAQCAALVSAKPNPAWRQVQERVYLPPMNAGGILPEYAGYTGGGIKQADLILAFYPLGFEADQATILKNVWHYHAKIMHYGPYMTTQIESCILLRLGEKDRGLRHLQKAMLKFIKGPHWIPAEQSADESEGREVATVMLTGIGGELQALIFGYYGATLDRLAAIPRIGAEWTKE